jgi:hypothetical protein
MLGLAWGGIGLKIFSSAALGALAWWRGREWLGDLDWSPRVDIAAADRTFLIKAKIAGVK